jgi:hypothetical protein
MDPDIGLLGYLAAKELLGGKRREPIGQASEDPGVGIKADIFRHNGSTLRSKKKGVDVFKASPPIIREEPHGLIIGPAEVFIFAVW